MKVTAAEIAKYMQILEKTPDRMTAASDKLTVAQLQGRPGSDEWSINDILAHLRACMDVWGKDIRTMLTEDNPRWRHLSPRTWLRKTNYPQLPFHESLATFVQERQELLELLRNLAIDDWSRSAMVKQGDKERQQTVFSRVRQMAMHEEGHWAQIEAILNMAELEGNV